MQYTITVTGIEDEEVAQRLAAHIDNNGAAFKSHIDIVLTTDGPAHAEPIWTNRQTVTCKRCKGFGYLDNETTDECPKCLGDGVVEAR